MRWRVDCVLAATAWLCSGEELSEKARGAADELSRDSDAARAAGERAQSAASRLSSFKHTFKQEFKQQLKDLERNKKK